MVLRFRSGNREISFRGDDCLTQTTGRYSPSVEVEYSQKGDYRQVTFRPRSAGIPPSRGVGSIAASAFLRYVDHHFRRVARGAHFRRRVQPCPTGLASVALLISAPSRLRVSRSDGRGDAKHAEGCRTRRLLSMACSTLSNKTNFCENCYEPIPCSRQDVAFLPGSLKLASVSKQAQR